MRRVNYFIDRPGGQARADALMGASDEGAKTFGHPTVVLLSDFVWFSFASAFPFVFTLLMFSLSQSSFHGSSIAMTGDTYRSSYVASFTCAPLEDWSTAIHLSSHSLVQPFTCPHVPSSPFHSFISYPIVTHSFRVPSTSRSSSAHCGHTRMGIPLAGGYGWPDRQSADPCETAESVR